MAGDLGILPIVCLSQSFSISDALKSAAVSLNARVQQVIPLKALSLLSAVTALLWKGFEKETLTFRLIFK